MFETLSNKKEALLKLLKEYPNDLTIGNLFYKQALRLSSNEFISFWKNNELKKLSWFDFLFIVKDKIIKLKAKGISKGDLVCIISKNSPDMMAYIIAITSIGAICCPIHYNLTIKQKIDFFKEYNYKLILLSQEEYKSICNDCSTKNLNVIIIDYDNLLPPEAYSAQLNFSDLFNYSVSANDIAYIMLSSGTTDKQKGIILTHKNILCNQLQLLSILDFITERDKYLSLLPLSHSYGGLAELYQVIMNGSSYHFCKNSDLNSLLEEINTIQPSIFQSVPATWEKLYKYLFDKSVNSEKDLKFYLGQNIRYGFSAGASIEKEIIKYFFKLNFPIYQGYGLTEASPGIAIASPEKFIKLTAGKILPEISLKIANDSEILVKGPNITNGYYNDPALNNSSFQNNYFKTGDTGEIIENKYLKFTGRTKNIIVLSTGEKIIPDTIENKLNSHPLIARSILIGNNKKFIACLIDVDKDKLILFANEHKINFINLPDLLLETRIQQEYQKVIDNVNSYLANFETIKKFILIEKPFISEELTPTLKLKREITEKRYAHIINKLYES
ncbi:MAG: AMP-binding protein [Cyanobacteriota bacterium]